MLLEFTPVSTQFDNQQSSQLAAEPKNLDEAFEEFLGFEVAQGAASPDTIANYKSQVKLFLQWCLDFEVNPLLALKQHIQQYRKYLIERHYKTATIELKLQVVRRFYDALIEHKMVERNPAKTVKAPVRRKSPAAIKYLSQEQFIELLKLTEGDRPKQIRDRLILGLMGLQGLRTVEVRNLNFGHLSSTNNRKSILVYAKRAERVVNLREDVYSLILNCLAGKKLTQKLPLICSLSGNNFGKRISRDGIRRVVNHYLEQIGVRGDESKIQLSNHGLRHTYGTLVYASTKDLRLVQESMGHSDPRTTAKYSHVIDEACAADYIDEISI